MGAETEVCLTIFFLLILLAFVGIYLRILKYRAYAAQVQTAKAMKRISRQGLTINQQYPPQYYQQPYAPQMQQPIYYPQQTPMFCPRCGKPSEGNAFCKYCGAKIN